jgi:hypothetical protein
VEVAIIDLLGEFIWGLVNLGCSCVPCGSFILFSSSLFDSLGLANWLLSNLIVGVEIFL